MPSADEKVKATFRYRRLPDSIIKRKGISDGSRILFAVILDFCRTASGWCYASDRQLAEAVARDKAQVHRWLRELLANGLLIRDPTAKRRLLRIAISLGDDLTLVGDDVSPASVTLSLPNASQSDDVTPDIPRTRDRARSRARSPSMTKNVTKSEISANSEKPSPVASTRTHEERTDIPPARLALQAEIARKQAASRNGQA